MFYLILEFQILPIQIKIIISFISDFYLDNSLESLLNVTKFYY